MCCGSRQLPSKDDFPPPPSNTAVVEDLRTRLADSEARLQLARAREAELSNRLEEMKRFVSVMEILENFLKRRFLQQEHQLSLFLSPPVRQVMEPNIRKLYATSLYPRDAVYITGHGGAPFPALLVSRAPKLSTQSHLWHALSAELL